MHVAFLAIAVCLALAVHQVGHALGGGLSGLRLALLIVGPVHVQRGSDGRLRWRLNTRLASAGGLVLSVPRNAAGLRRAMLCFVASGPVASMVLGLAALATWTLSDLPDPMFTDPESFLGAVSVGLLTLGVASCGLGLWTLLPRRQGTFANDGRQILSLRRASTSADRYAAVMALGGSMLAGIRPRDWDPEVVAQATSLADHSYVDLAGRHMAYENALDRGDVQTAREHIRYLVDRIGSVPINLRSVIDVEAAYFEAAYDGNAASARRRLDGASKRAVHALEATAPLCAEGALLLAEGDAARAYVKLREAHTALAKSSDWSSEAAMVEIRRLCRVRGLPDPGDVA